jgi:hypothetical protein
MVGMYQGDHMVCYDALQEAGLLPRLNQARAVAQEALYDPFTKQRAARRVMAIISTPIVPAPGCSS